MATEIVMPKLGMVMTEGTVSKWMKNTDDMVSQGEVVAEIETEKLNYELEATAAGKLHQVATEGSIVVVSGIMGYLLAEGEAVPEPPKVEAPVAKAAPVARRAAPAARTAGGTVPSTPGARKLAAKLGVDLSQVTATGPRGRVVEADVRGFSESGAGAGAGASADATKQAEAAEAAAILAGLPEPSKVVKMSGMRKGIAEHMTASIKATAQLTFTLDVPVTELQRRRKEWSRANKSPVTNTHVYAKACALVIGDLPIFNTVLAGGNIHYFDEVNIGVAVALPEGLIVPVVKDVANTPLADVAKKTSELTKKAQKGGISPDEMAGGTFTISVLGTVDTFTPILNRGQSAILGVGATQQKPVVEGGEVVVRDVCTFSLTVDHQTVDGAVAADFLSRFSGLLQSPDPLFP
jgi:pyruvate dehydrogenase E2 component (dihydrolipoamide acetyltransferase)